MLLHVQLFAGHYTSVFRRRQEASRNEALLPLHIIKAGASQIWSRNNIFNIRSEIGAYTFNSTTATARRHLSLRVDVRRDPPMAGGGGRKAPKG